MAFTRDRFALHFSLPLQAEDWANLLNSRARRVQLPIEFADPDTCLRLSQHGISLTLRVGNDAVRQPTLVAERIRQIQQYVVVDAAILGNEFDGPYSLDYGSPDWGVTSTFGLVQTLYEAWRVLKDLCPLVAPPMTMRSISEDSPPAPGRASWYAVIKGVYNLFPLNACHIYMYGWRSEVDRLRVKWALKSAQEYMHQPLMVDELGVASGSPVERMQAYCEIAAMLETHPLGDRVRYLSPFVSSGQPNGHWDAGFILRDPEAYRILGTFMMEGN